MQYVKIWLCMAEASSSLLCINYVLLNWKYFTYLTYICENQKTLYHVATYVQISNAYTEVIS